MLRVHAAAAAAVFSLALFVDPAAARGEWWPNVLVTDPPENNQDIGEGMAMDPDGNFTVVWDEDLPDGTGNVLLRRLGADGTPEGPPIRVNTSDGLHQYPSIASDGYGNFVVAWASIAGGDLQDLVILSRRYDAMGNPLGPETVLTAPGQFAGSGPRLAVNANGYYVVTWWQEGSQHARVFDYNGAPVADEFTMPDLGEIGSVGLNSAADVVAASMLGDGAVRLQCFTALGESFGPVTTVPTFGSTDYRSVSLTVHTGNTIALAWAEQRELDGTVQVHTFHSDCTTPYWSTEAVRFSGLQVRDARVVSSRDAHELGVSWISFDGSRYAGYVGMLDPMGAQLEAPREVTTQQVLLSGARLAIDDDGEIAVAWYQDDFVADGTYGDIYATGTAPADPCPAGSHGTIVLQPPQSSVNEGDNILVKAERVGGTCGTVSVQWSTTGPGAYGPYGLSGRFTWSDGSGGAAGLLVATGEDDVDDEGKTLEVALSAPTGGAVLGSPSSATIAVIDDDLPCEGGVGTFVASTPSSTYTEGDGIAIQISRVGGNCGAVRVSYRAHMPRDAFEGSARGATTWCRWGR